MPDLSTTYMGLKLKNPIIAASSGITKSVAKIVDCEKAGAGAVVIKSVFEEVLAQQDYGINDSATFHTEAYDYMRSELEMQYGPQEYCDLINEAKAFVDIPIIASINCISSKWWTNYAKKFQEAGADALELNIFKTATRLDETSEAIENMYYDIAETVKKQVTIPVALKIGSYFTALPNLAATLARKGINGLVLFNRFTEPDINIDKLSLSTTFSFSTSYDIYRPLRWTALLAGQIGCDISATTGAKSAKDVIKLLLAGASTVQIASLLYQKGIDSLVDIRNELTSWMVANKFEKISDFQGKLSFKNTKTPDEYLRAQFMEKIRGVE
ncbi:dihydroorotate dehydrogenase-like protein [candidate division KSB1 bacterium]|nr:dihydroorotate dehydrogenase-like protein [candidate division KSB1 bacterium]RQW06697.1 MAG: dihydroorotate dehydrogenase-like protein [candidate division KSB1 bacterium]